MDKITGAWAVGKVWGKSRFTKAATQILCMTHSKWVILSFRTKSQKFVTTYPTQIKAAWAKVQRKQAEGYYSILFFESTMNQNLSDKKEWTLCCICCRATALHCIILTGVHVILSTPCTVKDFHYRLSQEAERPYWEEVKDRHDFYQTTDAENPHTFLEKPSNLLKSAGKYPQITHCCVDWQRKAVRQTSLLQAKQN